MILSRLNLMFTKPIAALVATLAWGAIVLLMQSLLGLVWGGLLTLLLLMVFGLAVPTLGFAEAQKQRGIWPGGRGWLPVFFRSFVIGATALLLAIGLLMLLHLVGYGYLIVTGYWALGNSGGIIPSIWSLLFAVLLMIAVFWLINLLAMTNLARPKDTAFGDAWRAQKVWRRSYTWYAVLAALIGGGGTFGCFMIIAMGATIGDLMSQLSYDWAESPILILWEVPPIGLSYLAVVIFPIPFLKIMHGYVATITRAEAGDAASLPRLPHLVPVAAALAVLMSVYASVDSVYRGMVAAGASIGSLAFAFDVFDRVDGYVSGEVGKGTPAKNIINNLAIAGDWRSSEPPDDLIKMFPKLKESLKNVDDLNCVVSLGMAPISQAEVKRLEKVIVNQTELEGSGGKKTATSEADRKSGNRLQSWEQTQVKFCLRVRCIAPGWAPKSATDWIWTSHPTRQQGWAELMTARILPWGDKLPGGYCTAEGAFTEAYQG